MDDGRITGANRRNLDILSLQGSDSGAYTCDYYPKSGKALATYGPINIVVADGPVPAGSAMTMALSTAVSGCGALHCEAGNKNNQKIRADRLHSFMQAV